MKTAPPRSGDRFGRLVVIAAAWSRESHRRWYCRCDCGTTTITRETHMKQGRITSCGCAKTEFHRRRLLKHGLHGVPEYRVWKTMKSRCTSPGQQSFKYYGARGIGVCDRWRESFETFYADMGPRPGPQYSIDRINNDGHYEPGNCRWATATEQALNKRRRSAR